jgi:hypothetical protein
MAMVKGGRTKGQPTRSSSCAHNPYVTRLMSWQQMQERLGALATTHKSPWNGRPLPQGSWVIHDQPRKVPHTEGVGRDQYL